jgi:hypothetical protein
MKTFKLFAAGVLAAASIASASAATVSLRVTGSTAFRKAFYNSVVHILTSPKVACFGVVGVDGNNTTADWSGANRAVISGGHGVDTWVIECAWAGSVGGVNATANGLTTIPASGFASTATWLNTANITGTTPTATGTGTLLGFTEVGNGGGATFEAASIPEACMSDSFQSSTPFTSPVLNEESAATSGVGVVDFNWVKGRAPTSANGTTNAALAASYARFTNMTPLQANALMGIGELKLSFFTGNTADAGVDVVLVGRNSDSGTRLDTQAEADYGFGQAPENQYQTVGNPITTVNFVGDAGFSSGSGVRGNLINLQVNDAQDDAARPFIMVGYLGASDTATVLASNPVAQLTFNGLIDNQTNVQQGTYSFWAYEHEYYTNATKNSATKKAVADAISTQIRTVDGIQSGTLVGTMNCDRAVEGGLINPH